MRVLKMDLIFVSTHTIREAQIIALEVIAGKLKVNARRSTLSASG